MASPKGGSAGSAVAPADPTKATEAVDDQSGEVSTVEAPGAERTPPQWSYDPTKTSWIEIELVDMNGKPIAGASVEVKCPDGTVWSGTLDHKGFKRVNHIDPGNCEISFPDLDQDAWEPA